MVSKIEKAKYNRWYKWIREEEVPEYLKKERKEDKWRMVARFRLEGNKMKEGLYWREEERRCKRCGTEEKTGPRIGKMRVCTTEVESNKFLKCKTPRQDRKSVV